jgi:hypothetical protein
MLSGELRIDSPRPSFLIDADLVGAFIDVTVLLEVDASQKEHSTLSAFPISAHKVRD